MDEQELERQIEEGKSTVAKAENSIAEQKSLYEEAGVGEDLFAEVLASDNFTQEFKDIVKAERAKAISDMETQDQKHAPSKSSKIAGHAGVTKI